MSTIKENIELMLNTYQPNANEGDGWVHGEDAFIFTNGKWTKWEEADLGQEPIVPPYTYSLEQDAIDDDVDYQISVAVQDLAYKELVDDNVNSNFVIQDASSELIVRIHTATGEIEFGENYTPIEAAYEFWDQVSRLCQAQANKDSPADPPSPKQPTPSWYEKRFDEHTASIEEYEEFLNKQRYDKAMKVIE